MPLCIEAGGKEHEEAPSKDTLTDSALELPGWCECACVCAHACFVSPFPCPHRSGLGSRCLRAANWLPLLDHFTNRPREAALF